MNPAYRVRMTQIMFRDVQRSRGDPGRFVSVCLVTGKPEYVAPAVYGIPAVAYATCDLPTVATQPVTTCPIASAMPLPTTHCALPTCGEVCFR